jgi:YhcH/YjgK/YiaL family protein
MIHDTLENAAKYCTIHPLFEKAFNFLNSQEIESLAIGKTKLEGDDLVINVVDMHGKKTDDALMETHDQFIDIHIPIGGTETMGWISRSKTKKISVTYDSDKDLTFYNDEASYFMTVQPYEFAIFFPEDGHQPGIGEGIYKKIIIKVKL